MRIRLENITFTYNSIKALEHITLDIFTSEVTCFIGPNGAGKTTLLRLIASQLKPVEGAVYIDGKDYKLYKPRELARIVSYSDPHIQRSLPMRVVDFILTSRYPFQRPLQYFEDNTDLELVDRISSWLGVSNLLDRRLDQLSSGELQRVIIAAALAKKPRVLLLDEPSAFLDVRYRFEIMEVVKGYTRANGVVTVVALHDIYLASMFCDKVVLLDKGRIEACGAPAEVLSSSAIEKVYGVRVEVVTLSNGSKVAVTLPIGADSENRIVVHES